MDKKEFDYIDSELKKISIMNFKYEGNRASGEPIFAFERIVDENDSYCIVLDGSQDKEVEIQAETDYNSGANEYIDKLVSLNSWREAIEYLQNNSQKLAKDAEKKYLLNKQKLEKTAKIMGMTTPVAGKLERIARRIIAEPIIHSPNEINHPTDDSIAADIWRMMILRCDEKAPMTDPRYRELHEKVADRLFDDDGTLVPSNAELKDIHHALVYFTRFCDDFDPETTSKEMLDIVENGMSERGMTHTYKGYKFDIKETDSQLGKRFNVSYYKNGNPIWTNQTTRLYNTYQEAERGAKDTIDNGGNASR